MNKDYLNFLMLTPIRPHHKMITEGMDVLVECLENFDDDNEPEFYYVVQKMYMKMLDTYQSILEEDSKKLSKG